MLRIHVSVWTDNTMKYFCEKPEPIWQDLAIRYGIKCELQQMLYGAAPYPYTAAHMHWMGCKP